MTIAYVVDRIRQPLRLFFSYADPTFELDLGPTEITSLKSSHSKTPAFNSFRADSDQIRYFQNMIVMVLSPILAVLCAILAVLSPILAVLDPILVVLSSILVVLCAILVVLCPILALLKAISFFTIPIRFCLKAAARL